VVLGTSAARRGRNRDWPWAIGMIAPVGLGLGVFYLWPLVRTVYFSFTEWGAFGGHTWAGLENYRTLLADPDLAGALRNTFVYTAIVLLAVPLSIVLAVLLNVRGLRGVGVYRTLYFLPVVTMPAAIAMLWRWIYNGDYGVLNYLLSLAGIDGPHWVANPDLLLYSMAVVGIWMVLGYNAVIFLAGLQGIPEHYYEAAELDGAGRVRQFFSITLPLLSPSIFFVTVLSVIGSLQMFDLLFMMTGGVNGQLARDQNRTIVYLFYRKAFEQNEQGYGAAIAVVLLVVILALTAVQFRLQKRWVHYE
jgi:multiple sugar transport system permease protein